MKTFNTIILLFCSILLGKVVQAQPGPEKFERIESLKIKFITDQMDLTPAEAKQFWPLYNEFQKKMRSIKSEASPRELIRRDGVEWEDMSEEEIENFVLNHIDRDIKVAQLRREYYFKFKEAVGVNKTARYFKAEVEFRKHLVRRLSRAREGLREEK